MPTKHHEQEDFPCVTPEQGEQLWGAAQGRGWDRFLWMRPDSSITDFERASAYALTCDGYAYEASELEPRGANLNDLCDRCEDSGWRVSFVELRMCLFQLQRSFKWLSGSGEVPEIEAAYMACYKAACEAWEREHPDHLPEVRAAYKAMAKVLAGPGDDGSNDAGPSPRKLSPDRARRFGFDGLDDGITIVSQRGQAMSPQYTPHKKLSLRRHPQLNEAWLHDRICDDPSLLGLGDVRVLDRERSLTGGGRLDLLLLDDDNDRRFEVEIQLGSTDPSHIIRAIEYWDLERKKYPAYEHVAVIVAEDVTTRFLNVMSLMSGSIPMIAIQLDALEVGEHLVLNFVQVLDLTELRADDVAEEDSGGGNTDRPYWDAKAGKALMGICDAIKTMVQQYAKSSVEFNYLRHYMGLRYGGVVRNVVSMSPKRTKNYVNVGFQVSDAVEWKAKFEEAGVPVQSKRKNRFLLKLNPEDLKDNAALIEQAVQAAITEAEI